MQEIVKRIKAQQKAMGATDIINRSLADRMQYIRNISLALVKETAEFLDEVPWKPWGNITEQHFDQSAASLEVCDIMVFAIVLHLTINPEASLEEAMERTLTKIDNRIKNNYKVKEKP